MENKFFYLTNEDGTKTECELLFTFELTSTEKKYAVFADAQTDLFGNIPISVYCLVSRGSRTYLEGDCSDYELSVAQYLLENKMAVKYN